MEFRRKTKKNKVRKKKCSRFGGTGSQFIRQKKKSRSHAVSCPIIGRNGKKVHKVRRDLFGKLIWDFNAKFWALGPTLLIGHGWHVWSELARVTLGKSCRLGDGQYNHPLPWSGPMLFKSSMDKGFHLSMPFAAPLINAQIHPNRHKTC